MEFKELDQVILGNQEGFTLIEVLISIAILSVLMVSVYTIVDNSMNTNDRVSKEDREKLQLEIGLMRITRDLELIHSPLYFDSAKIEDNKLFAKTYKVQDKPGGSQLQKESNQVVMTSHIYPNKNYDNLSSTNAPIPIMLNEEKGSLVFLSSSNRRLIKNAKQSDLIWVRYRVATTNTDGVDEADQNKDAPYSLTRTVIPKNIFDPDLNWEGAKEYAVINNLKDFYFEFYNPEKEAFVKSLRELNKFRNTPRLIRITMEYVSKTGEELSIQRTIRVLWPQFDAEQDLKEKYDFKK